MYEQRMEECHRNLMALKDHLQFNERFIRQLIRENRILQLKITNKGQLFASSSDFGKSEDKQRAKEELRKELDTLHQEQEAYETRYESQLHVTKIKCIISNYYPHRLKDARNDTMELKKQLYSIEGQVNDVKSHLHRLQEQKYKLTGELYKQECALNQIITGGISVNNEDDVS